MFKLNKLLLILLSLTFIGCSSTSSKNNFKKYSDQQVSEMIIDGKTTKSEVKAQLGEPTDIDFDDENREKWTYSYTQASKNPINYIPVVSILAGQDGMTRKLVIVFNHDIVLKHALSVDNGKIKKGILSR
ncbi:MAG: hypothetical protein WBJ81_03445 [Rickettsiales bacterium]